MRWPPRWVLNRLSPGGTGARLHVLLYHRVMSAPDPLIPGHSEADFEWQLALLQRHFNVLPLREAVRLFKQGALPPRAACVSFDDGFADTLNLAMPIADRLGVPITVFVATRYLNGGIMFNDRIGDALARFSGDSLDLGDLGLGRLDLSTTAARVAALHALIDGIKYRDVDSRLELAEWIGERAGVAAPNDLMLDEAGLRALHRRGVEIGAHTDGHPILALCDEAEARREIVTGKQRLEAILGAPVTLFAYPNGKPGKDFTERDVRLVREAGFEGAFSTGMSGTHDAYRLPRFTPWDRKEWRFVLRLMRFGR